MIARLAWIVGAYLAASVASAVVVLVEEVISGAPASANTVVGILLGGSCLAAVFAVVPAAAIIGIGEGYGVRSAAYYAVAGAAVALCAWWLLSVRAALDFPAYSISVLLGLARVIAIPGLVAGIVYWWIAGRRAGKPR